MSAAQLLPTHVRHVKRGTTYAVLGVAQLQTSAPLGDDAEIAVYQGEDGKLWARPLGEILDGRFVMVLPPPATVETSTGGTSVVVVRWAWTEQPCEGRTFWGAYEPGPDGCVSGWPKAGMKALGAAAVTVVDGVGLDFLKPAQTTSDVNAQDGVA